jgi:arabinofuranosyltransferase
MTNSKRRRLHLPGIFSRVRPWMLLLLALLALAGAYMFAALRTDPFGTYSGLVDDAYIPLRFAHNAASGYGLVWNRGDVRVDGFTSLLWLLILLGIEKAGRVPLAYLVPLGAFFAVACMGLALLLLHRLNPGRHNENLTGAILLGLTPIFWYWSMAGLETTLYAALLLAACLAYLAQRAEQIPAWGSGAVFGLLALTRPEGALLFGLTLLLDALLVWRFKEGRFRRTLGLAAGFAIVYLPAFMWEWWYFGDPLPNTYYAKTGAGWLQIQGGWNYLVGSLQALALGTGLPLLLALVTFGKPRLERPFIAFMALSSCLLVVLEGGDHFPHARFLVPVLPLLFVLAGLGLSDLTAKLAPVNRTLFLVVLIGVAVLVFHPAGTLAITPAGTRLTSADPAAFQYNTDPDAGFVVMGKALRRLAAPGQSIAVVPIGAIGYFSDLRVFDMVGLVDPHIAHEPFDPQYTATWRPGHDKGDGLYVLGRRPDYIQLVDGLTSQPLPGVDAYGMQFKSVVEIWKAPEFHALYEFYPMRVEGRWYYNLYRLKSDAP